MKWKGISVSAGQQCVRMCVGLSVPVASRFCGRLTQKRRNLKEPTVFGYLIPRFEVLKVTLL